MPLSIAGDDNCGSREEGTGEGIEGIVLDGSVGEVGLLQVREDIGGDNRFRS